MADAFPLDPNIFWEIVASFAEYDYSFPDAGVASKCPDPSAKPGYPHDIVARATERGAPGLASALDAEGAQGTNYLGRRYTNCCMFVEAVLIGTALRTHADFGKQWIVDLHHWAMNRENKGDTKFGPPRAYAAVGIADDILDIAATTKLVPGEIYVVQGLKHNWFIVDCNEAGLCLRLEATFANELHPEMVIPRRGTNDAYGAVVHGGFRGVGAKPDRREWVPALLGRKGFEHKWDWETLRAALLQDLRAPGGDAYVSMARVRMRPSSPGPWLPYEIADAHGRALTGQAALADAWQHTLSANAPFPLGINRTWHNGIHIDATAGTAVRPFASGELVAARFPTTPKDGIDYGAIIVRHRFDPKALAFIALDEAKREHEVTFYSALVHLRGGAEGAKQLVDTLCPPTTAPDLRVPATEPLDVFVFDRDGVAHELAVSKWANDRNRSLPLAVEVGGVMPKLVVHLDADEQYARAQTVAAPEPIAAPAEAHAALFDATTRALWPLQAQWSTTPIGLRCEADGAGRWSVRELTHDDSRTWMPPAAPPKVTGTPQCVHSPTERNEMSRAATDVLVTRAGAVRFTVTVGAAVCSGGVILPRLVVSAVGATPAKATTRWRPCVKVTATEVAAGSIAGANHMLALHDVDGGRVYETKVAAGVGPIALAGAVPSNPRFAYVAGSTVTLGCDAGCCHTVDEVAAFSRHPAKSTVGTFVDAQGIAVALGKTAARLVATRMHAVVDDRGTIDLQPSVGLDDDQLTALLDRLAAQRRAAGAEAADRMRAGTSRVVAVPLAKNERWVDEHGCLRLATTATELVVHHRLTSGDANTWWFDERTKQTLPPPPASLAWPVLRVIQAPGKPNLRAALVEVVLAAPRDRFDDSAKKMWERVEALRQRVCKDLVAGWVDFAAVERDDPEHSETATAHRWRWLGRTPIGTVGRPAPDHIGVHLEVFAKNNVIDPTVANGRWEELGADIDAEPRTPEFERAVETLLSNGRLGQLALAAPTRDELARGARRPTTWAEFCNDPDVAAMLAEVVAVHTNEWTTAWGEVLVSRDRGGPGVAGTPLNDAWPSNAEALGLPSGKLRYYHPLRLLEWLTTGVDVRVHLHGSRSSKVRAGLTFDGDDRELDLTPRVGGDEVTFVRRALLGRSLPTTGALSRSATITVHDTLADAVIPKVPLVMSRGEITRIELVEPGSRVMRVASGSGSEDNGWLLADAAQRFAKAACSRVEVTVTLFFNSQRPANVALSIDHPRFAIVPTHSDAYTYGGDAQHCTFVAQATAPTAPPRAQQITLHLGVTTNAPVGVTATLTVTVASADGNPGHTHTIDVGTRQLGVAADEHGRDVEKLQIYLTRISAEGAPCHRGGRKPGEPWRAGESGGKALPVLALWRFIVAFGGKPPWAATFIAIACERGQYAIPNMCSEQQFEVPSPLDEGSRWIALDTEAKRLMTKHGRPRIEGAMIQELVRVAAMPHVMPQLTLAFDVPNVAAPLTAAAAKLETIERALLLPCPAVVPEQAAKIIVSAEAVAGDPGSVWLDVVLTGTAYAVAGAASSRRTLADLIAHGIVLVATGAIDGKAHAIELRATDTSVAKLALPGTRDLFATRGGAGVDVLYMQRWLTIHHDTAGKPYLAAVTGKWDKTGRQALERFRDERCAKTADFATTTAALAVPPAPVVPPTAATPSASPGVSP